MIAYVTKHALTRGVFAIEGELLAGHGRRLKPKNGYMSLAATEWSEDYGTAVKQAEERRDKRIASLRKQLAKLEALTFPSEAPEVEGVGE